MKKPLREIFDDLLGSLFDKQETVKKLIKDLYIFKIKFINKSSDHLQFFGGNLIGNYKLVFSVDDFNNFFEHILGISKERINYSVKTYSTINTEFKVSSDPFNLTIVYLMYKFLTCKFLKPEEKKNIAEVIAAIGNFKWLSSITNHFFKYPITKDMAESVYAMLTKRFLIKRLSTWIKVIEFRSAELVSKEVPNRKAIENFTDDDVVKYLNDAQGRIKDIVKNIFSVYREVYESNSVVKSVSSTGKDIEGEDTLLDMVTGAESYINYILSVLPDHNSFIKKEIMDIAVSIVPNVQLKQLEKTLSLLSNFMLDTRVSKHTTEFVRTIITYAYDYLKDNKYLSKNSKNIIALIGKLKGVFIASRGNDGSLLEIRDTGNTIVKEAIGKINPQAQASLRNAMVMYILTRTFTRHHYQE